MAAPKHPPARGSTLEEHSVLLNDWRITDVWMSWAAGLGTISCNHSSLPPNALLRCSSLCRALRPFRPSEIVY